MKFDLTVIIPNYNNEKYIEQCLDSILCQSYQPEEIIVFDDSSTDGSALILKRYEKQYTSIKVIYSKENVGVSAARDQAIRKAKTNFVTMIDADDYYIDPNKLLNEMLTIKKYYESEHRLACAFSQVVRVSEEGIALDRKKVKKYNYFTRLGMVSRAFRYNVPRDYCFSKELYMQVGGYNFDYKIYEDWDIELKLLSKCRFLFSNNFGTAYRQRKGGLSDKQPEIHLNAKKEIFESNAAILHYTFIERLSFYMLLYISHFLKIIKRK